MSKRTATSPPKECALQGTKAKVPRQSHHGGVADRESDSTSMVLVPENSSYDKVPQLSQTRTLLTWIKDLGAELSSITISSSPHCGLGGIAASEIPPGGLIGRIPNRAVMSVDRSSKSLVGCAVAETTYDEAISSPSTGSPNEDDIPCRPTREFVMWLDMCHGRRYPDHSHHPYLAALPSKAPDVPSWSLSERSELEGTNVGASAEKAAKELKDQYNTWMPNLRKAHPRLFGDPVKGNENTSGFSLKDLIWARGMYYSRRFPPILLSGTEDAVKERKHAVINADNKNEVDQGSKPDVKKASNEKSTVGILLPALDLFNHTLHQQITWSGSPTHVSFFAGASEGIAAGCGIYNNYGPKGNEMLMLMYGFALKNNVHDNYGLHLVMMVQRSNAEGGAVMEKRSLGTFQIHRTDSPMDPQFPPALWKALNQMFEVEDDDGNRDPADNGNAGRTDAPVEIGLEAVELLLETLKRRIQPFLATKAKDCLCETHVATYRDGQRFVLEEAIEILEEMLPEEEDELEGEGEEQT
jgi:hypothetical protein